LAVLKHDAAYWRAMVPALKSFFGQVGGTDSVSLSSVQLENGAATHTVLGPFTSNGSFYFDAIDRLARPASEDLPIVQALTESITSAAGAGAGASVVVLGPPWVLSLADVQTATALARQLGVRISNVDYLGTYGVPEMTPRTGGFVAEVMDPRQFSIVLGALDPLLAGSLPFYRMEFRVTSERGAFVSGGNAKVRIKVDVPTSLPTIGVWSTADVAIQ
jgi:hypothetical protein